MFSVNLRSLLRTDLVKLSVANPGCRILLNGRKKELRDGTLSRFIGFNSGRKKVQVGANLWQIHSKRWVISSKKQQEGKRSTFFTWKSIVVTIVLGGSYMIYIGYLSEEKRKKMENERIKQIGKAKIGGGFELVDQDNRPVSDKDFLGQWLLVYFGFTHCPDVCPDEIEKMVNIVDTLDKELEKPILKPIFITVDPERDNPGAVKKYLEEFSSKIIGLTGTKEQVDKVCKAYRVYYSAGPKDDDNDYIVDHTIIIYLIGPDGQFIDYYSQTKSVSDIVNEIKLYMNKYDIFKSKGIVRRLKEYF